MTALPILGGPPARRRAVLMRRVRWLVAATITYNVVEAVVAISAGTVASTSALIGFGLDSTIEVASAAAVAWQFSGRDPEAMITRVKQLARLAGLPANEADACATSAERQNQVVAMRFAGEQMFQIRGTPTLIINGKRHDGSTEFADLDKLLRPMVGRG